MRYNIIPCVFIISGCTLTFPIIPMTNYVPVHSELSKSKCNNRIGISQIKFEDVREENGTSSRQTYIYAEDGFIDSIKRAEFYSSKSPISVVAKLKRLDFPDYVSEIEYIVRNVTTKQTQSITFKGNCSAEGDNATTIGHFSDTLGCAIRKNYAQFIRFISIPSKENMVCK